MQSSSFAWLLVATCCAPCGVDAQQAQADRAFPLAVRAGPYGSLRCFETAALRRRIAYYGGTRSADNAELKLDLYVDSEDSAELHVYRGDALLARRRFLNLPSACADRRDTVALSIALSLEGAARELARAREVEASASAAASSASASAPSGASAASNSPGTGGLTGRDTAPLAAARPGQLSAAMPEQPTAARPEQPTAAKPEQPAAARPSTLEAARPGQLPAAGASSPRPAPPALQPSAADPNALEQPLPRDVDQTSPEAGVGPAGETGILVQLHLGGRWLAEALPSAVWLGAVGVELWLTRNLALDAAAFTSSVSNSELVGARAQARLSGGELLGCAGWKLERQGLAAQGCVGFSAAAARVSGHDYPVPAPGATLLWAAGIGRLAVRWPDAGLVAVRLIAQAHVNATRPELRVDGAAERLSASALGAELGLELIVSLK